MRILTSGAYMLTEIEIEDVGIYRLPNMWQQARINHMERSRRHTAILAYGMGMTVPQFKKLSQAKRDEIQAAFFRLTSPANMPRIKR